MYIKRIKIQNIRSISDFEMTFPKPEGWHVLIGENGSGKSSIVRAVAAALVGEPEIHAARLSWHNWLKKGKIQANVQLELLVSSLDNNIISEFSLIQKRLDLICIADNYVRLRDKNIKNTEDEVRDENGLYITKNKKTFFSAGYGPLRRFSGGDDEKKELSKDYPNVDAHLSLFGEDVALTESLKWLWDIYDGLFREEHDKFWKKYIQLSPEEDSIFDAIESGTGQEENANETVKELLGDTKRMKVLYKKSKDQFQYIKTFLNDSNLLPHDTKLEGFDQDKNIIFKDNNGNTIPAVEMSDGYRSILSLMFDLIRQLVRVYGEEAVFKNIQAGEMNIPLPGVVLIDEVDAHLHPNWQISIGQWFTKCFPKIQFIVTTHSPFVCRACEEDKGTIWQLAAPIDGEEQHREIIGNEKKRLIYGNILDAYGTRLFGDSSVRSIKSEEKLQRLGRLNARYALGKITKEEEVERSELLKILQTDDPTGF